MALIKCPECGAQISDAAPACVHCGCPLPEKTAVAKRTEPIAAEPETVLPEEQAIRGMEPDGRTCKLKRLLVLILGCTAWTIGMAWQFLFYSNFWAFVIIAILRFTAMYGAMILFHTARKKTFARILAAAGLCLTLLQPVVQILTYSALYHIRAEGFLSLNFISGWLLNMFLAVLLFVYVLTGAKGKNGIFWFIIYLGLTILQQVLNFSPYLPSIIQTLHAALFFAVGYSPNKWYCRRTGPTPQEMA